MGNKVNYEDVEVLTVACLLVIAVTFIVCQIGSAVIRRDFKRFNEAQKDRRRMT